MPRHSTIEPPGIVSEVAFDIPEELLQDVSVLEWKREVYRAGASIVEAKRAYHYYHEHGRANMGLFVVRHGFVAIGERVTLRRIQSMRERPLECCTVHMVLGPGRVFGEAEVPCAVDGWNSYVETVPEYDAWATTPVTPLLYGPHPKGLHEDQGFARHISNCEVTVDHLPATEVERALKSEHGPALLRLLAYTAFMNARDYFDPPMLLEHKQHFTAEHFIPAWQQRLVTIFERHRRAGYCWPIDGGERTAMLTGFSPAWQQFGFEPDGKRADWNNDLKNLVRELWRFQLMESKERILSELAHDSQNNSQAYEAMSVISRLFDTGYKDGFKGKWLGMSTTGPFPSLVVVVTNSKKSAPPEFVIRGEKKKKG